MYVLVQQTTTNYVISYGVGQLQTTAFYVVVETLLGRVKSNNDETERYVKWIFKNCYMLIITRK